MQRDIDAKGGCYAFERHIVVSGANAARCKHIALWTDKLGHGDNAVSYGLMITMYPTLCVSLETERESSGRDSAWPHHTCTSSSTISTRLRAMPRSKAKSAKRWMLSSLTCVTKQASK